MVVGRVGEWRNDWDKKYLFASVSCALKTGELVEQKSEDPFGMRILKWRRTSLKQIK